MEKIYDVFISHSSKDKQIANAICHRLESNNIRCWMAPRDINPGEEWAGAINKAIEKSKIFVLVYSGNSNTSIHVMNELNLAQDNCEIIIPFRIEDVPLSHSMKYYLARVHWLDAITEPREKQINELVERIINNLPERKAEIEAKAKKVAEQKAKNESREREIDVPTERIFNYLPKRKSEIEEGALRRKSVEETQKRQAEEARQQVAQGSIRLKEQEIKVVENFPIHTSISFVGIGKAGNNMIKDFRQLDTLSGSFIEIDGDENQYTVYETPWFKTSKTLILCAGLGGNTGTEEILKITQKAKEAGKTVLACVTVPFTFEGRTRIKKAREALKELQYLADNLIELKNDDLLLMGDPKTTTMLTRFEEGNRLLAEQVQNLLYR